MQKSPWVIITGGSSGIGFELAQLFAKDDYNLVLVARDKEKLENAAKNLRENADIHVKIIPQDLTESDFPEKIFKELDEDSIDIEILVNNAGFGVYGEFAKTDAKKELDSIRLNVEALTHLTKLFLPGMLERKSGKILNVASLAAFMPGPLMAVYFATKAYVLSFSESLAEELKGTGVTVTCLCPGPVPTGFQKVAYGEDLISSLGFLTVSAQKAAKEAYKGLFQGQRVVIPGNSKFIPPLIRLTPRSLVAKFVKRWNR